ncbi:MAG: TraB/GumN family protein, partial [Planctomycetota bacterium]
AVFQSFTRDEQVQMLKDSLDLLDEYESSGRNALEEMIGAWLSGDAMSLVQLLDDGFGKDPALRERAEAELLWKRNIRFAERMEAKMTAAPAETHFFAIGALHIPDAKQPKGEQGKVNPKLGVVELMRQRGYQVTRFTAAKAEAAK